MMKRRLGLRSRARATRETLAIAAPPSRARRVSAGLMAVVTGLLSREKSGLTESKDFSDFFVTGLLSRLTGCLGQPLVTPPAGRDECAYQGVHRRAFRQGAHLRLEQGRH